MIKPLLVLGVCTGLFILLATLCSRERVLHGLLIDLELQGPDSSRYSKLRDALTRRIPGEVGELRGCRVTLEYAHFSDLDRGTRDPARIDFLVLSPQGTPWHAYREEAGKKLNLAKRLVKDLILKDGLPALGVCGGHQFLALAFGGTVGFIDRAYVGKFPERYPADAAGERGVTTLEILKADPILQGVASRPGGFQVVQSHHEEVKTVPAPFVNLARSRMSEAQLIRIPGRIVYGMAFHPERCWDEDDCPEGPVMEGRRILANFLIMVYGRGR